MATMKDIARLAGVSTSTVSHVINKSRYVSEEISERVNKAAQELNYTP
ncbi:LacI family DNA-binding transcriptional regulator, partial [Vibrio coralliilyticus]